MHLIDLIKYILLGIVQGITKVLPVSSSGHVEIFKLVLGIHTEQATEFLNNFFLALMNLGSLIAVLIYFRKFIIELFVKFYRYIFKKDRSEEAKINFHYVWMIVIASIPVAVFGYFLQQVLMDNYFSKYMLVVVGIGSLIGATFLYVVRDSANKHVNQTLTYKDAIIIGLIQPLSVIPGLSRFAITTSTGLMRKVSMDTALRFSMFLYIPVSIGVMLGYAVKWYFNPSIGAEFAAVPWSTYAYFAAAFLTSIFATYYAIKWVFIYFRRGKLMIFAAYSMVLGFIALIAGLIRY